MRDPFWHFESNGQPCGPVPESELRRLLQGGAVNLQTRIWREGLHDWVTIAETLSTTPDEARGSSPAFPALHSDSTGPIPQDHIEPLPWEQRRSPAAALETLWLVLRMPAAALGGIPQGGSAGPSLFFNILTGTLGFFLAILAHQFLTPVLTGMALPTGSETPPAGLQNLLAPFPLVPLLIGASALLQAGFLHLCLFLLGIAASPFNETFKVCNYASGTAAVFAMFPFIGPVLSMVWSAFALSVGLAIVHQAPWPRTATAVFIPFALVLVLQLALS